MLPVQNACRLNPGSVSRLPCPLPLAPSIKGRTSVSYPIVHGESLERACIDDIPYTTDAHKYYAYPLGVLTAVAVDAPLTLAANAVALGACAVGAVIVTPCAGVYDIYEACTQNAADAKQGD